MRVTGVTCALEAFIIILFGLLVPISIVLGNYAAALVAATAVMAAEFSCMRKMRKRLEALAERCAPC